MKQAKFLSTVFIGTLILIFSSCSEEDGSWDPMKLTKQEITFNSNGGVDSIQVTNYSMMWMASVYEGASSNPTKIYNTRDSTIRDAQIVRGDWFQATADILPSKKNWMYIYADKNTSGKDRELTITLTAGDIFHDISVKQLANTK
mgnify:FL=1